MHQYIGIGSDILDRNFAVQRNSMWCWAASIQMILRYYGITLSQEVIVKRTFGVDQWGNIQNKPASFDVMTAQLNRWGIDMQNRHYEVRAILYPGAPQPNLLLRELKAKRPILISYQSRPRMNHAVVCSGAKIATEFNITSIKSIIVRDPAPYKKNIDRNRRIEHRAATLAAKSTAYWIIRVSKMK